ncbi:MAG: acetyl-CoA carboxylase biotin carboxyl carrier protein [Alphaproteobacteria bacterium]|nr:acetyl-CoA carboxylase biotin carboxyl carrier protein [Alphaproteobacteria bacterium]MDE2012913.1 acetyl-CoA carboxylase biotin carboxyl carrier protein [Alphaproteobacteria bacterium]MDE2074053.1 acetyl-CoA carboxylase biotin carboxyl carrier protein [Alphaproteobacteria bacterium]MDE2351871.1 acetyl-CoA carboxylase biotin carboxyl carrier protein [Alphaproteobacteria bacterium]
MSLTAKDVAEILKLLEESAFNELVLETGELKVELRRGEAAARPVRTRESAAPPVAAAAKPVAGSQIAAPPPGLADVPSPLLGVFYRAPKPGEPPFVEVGQKIEEDTIIGIIEVMKLMNSVRAGVRGELVEIFAQNATLVEYGQPLVRVRAAG